MRSARSELAQPQQLDVDTGVQAGAEDSVESDDEVQLARVQTEDTLAEHDAALSDLRDMGSTIRSCLLTGMISSAPPSTSSLKRSGRCSRN
jgi:hypothetical protein